MTRYRRFNIALPSPQGAPTLALPSPVATGRAARAALAIGRAHARTALTTGRAVARAALAVGRASARHPHTIEPAVQAAPCRSSLGSEGEVDGAEAGSSWTNLDPS